MFTGIVTDLGRLRGVERRGDARFSFETSYDTGAIALGASIACSGVCLTVVDTGPDWFAADVSAETLASTGGGSLPASQRMSRSWPGPQAAGISFESSRRATGRGWPEPWPAWCCCENPSSGAAWSAWAWA